MSDSIKGAFVHDGKPIRRVDECFGLWVTFEVLEVRSIAND